MRLLRSIIKDLDKQKQQSVDAFTPSRLRYTDPQSNNQQENFTRMDSIQEHQSPNNKNNMDTTTTNIATTMDVATATNSSSTGIDDTKHPPNVTSTTPESYVNYDITPDPSTDSSHIAKPSPETEALLKRISQLTTMLEMERENNSVACETIDLQNQSIATIQRQLQAHQNQSEQEKRTLLDQITELQTPQQSNVTKPTPSYTHLVTTTSNITPVASSATLSSNTYATPTSHQQVTSTQSNPNRRPPPPPPKSQRKSTKHTTTKPPPPPSVPQCLKVKWIRIQ